VYKLYIVYISLFLIIFMMYVDFLYLLASWQQYSMVLILLLIFLPIVDTAYTF